ncbi:Rv3235 family protein [Rhodococcus sp. NPDC058532]|uniref:Rv3235 family protein n=1 Tax=Rhodococcus sp. NPDC058532 TaxID=3346540 RepID=UPI00364A358C
MRTYVTDAPSPEPPTEPTPPRHTHRLALRTPRPLPHRTLTPRHAAAADRHPAGDGEAPGVPDLGCRRFGEMALRMVLEALDRRRHLSTLRPLLGSTPFDLVTAVVRAGAPGRGLGTAHLRRVHVRPLDQDRAEVFGSYVRGGRTFAIAGRLERAPAARRRSADAGGAWRFTSLQVG